MTEVRLAGGAQGFNWLPVFVAEDQGLFEKHGLKIDYMRLGSVDKATSAVRDGTADLAITPPEGAVSDYVSGGGLRIIAANSLRLPMSLVARPEIGSIAELRGKRIGTSSLTEGTAIYTQAMLQPEGLSYPGDYEFVLAGVHTTRWAALQRDEIDCAPQPAPWNFLAEREGYRLIGEVNDVIPEVVFAAIIGTGAWTSQNRDTVEKPGRRAGRGPRHRQRPGQRRRHAADLSADHHTRRAGAGREGAGLHAGHGHVADRGSVVAPAALAATTDLMVRAGSACAGVRATAAGVLDPTFVRRG